MTQFVAVVAYDKKLGIVKDGIIPWKLPQDKWWYRQLIADSTVISSQYVFTGRTSHQPPPRRRIVISQKLSTSEEFEVVQTVEAALDACRSEALVYVCGGESIYTLLAEHTSTVIATEVAGDYGCDRFFPDFHRHWQSQPIARIPVSNLDPEATMTVYNR